MQITLTDVAKKAETSVSTVSRALDGHPAISSETIERVRQIADDMRYRRVRSQRRANPAKGVLAGRTIGLLSLGLDQSLVSMPVTTEAFRGAQDALVEAGAKSHVFHMPDLSQLPVGFRTDRMDGLILTGPKFPQFAAASDTPALKQLRQLPTVWVVCDPPKAWGDSVVAADFEVGYGAAERLVASGHRNLAFLNPVPDNLMFARREDGFLSAARRLGVDVKCFCRSPAAGWHLPIETPLVAFEPVQLLVDQILASQPRRTAIFAASDSVAALVYCALGIRGLRVGHDISVIAANNTPGLLSVPYPHLATFDIQARTMGTVSVRQLATQISDKQGDKHIPIQVVLKPSFIPGESVCVLADSGSTQGR
ncbi:MAG: LacI family DNA-binding transcriptional regulator [Pirellulales bacterium]|nr:LacI family DNA-binding transcriptional regulator [Pirellulales bacterium]